MRRLEEGTFSCWVLQFYAGACGRKRWGGTAIAGLAENLFIAARSASLRAPLSKNAIDITVSVTLAVTILCVPAMPQSGPTPAPRGGTQILLLGTHGGPPLSRERSEPSSLLIVDSRLYLIDCGIGTMRQMVVAGVRSEDVGTIFITHHHPDHDLGLAEVIGNDFFNLDIAGATRQIQIYGPPQTEELVKAAFDYVSIPFGVFAAEGLPGASNLRSANGTLASPFVAHDIQHDGVVYEDDKLRVIAAENSHFATMPEQFRARMRSYSYRFETPHGVIVFTGDTGQSDAVVSLAHGAEVLVTEGGVRASGHAVIDFSHLSPEVLKRFQVHQRSEHLSVSEVGMLASEARVKSVLLYHQNSAADNVPPATKISEVKQHFPGPVFVGADLDRYCLGQAGKSPSSPTLSLCQ